MAKKHYSTRQLTRMAEALGGEFKREFVGLRENYKRHGMLPREAAQRAADDLKLIPKYEAYRRRKTAQEMLDRQVPMTESEIRAVLPNYRKGEAKPAEQVGNEEMSLAEQVAWAKRWAARVQNGEPAPTHFPNDGALFWFQSAISNRREFEKVVLRVESPAAENDQYLQDGQYQLKQIESQIREAVEECGKKLIELEGDFAELLGKVSGT